MRAMFVSVSTLPDQFVFIRRCSVDYRSHRTITEQLFLSVCTYVHVALTNRQSYRHTKCCHVVYSVVGNVGLCDRDQLVVARDLVSVCTGWPRKARRVFIYSKLLLVLCANLYFSIITTATNNSNNMRFMPQHQNLV